MKILFAGGGTGGHLYPGLAIARALVRRDPRVQPFFVGARRGIERDVLPTTEFPHALLDLHPLYRSRPWENWKTLRGGISAWRELGRIAARERPVLAVGTGGYAMAATLAWAGRHGLPYVQQVADSHPGLTARLFSKGSRELYLGFPEAAGRLERGPRTEVVASGNPIEPPPEPLPDRAAARARWGFPERGGVVVTVFGGSQGARAINEAVGAWVRKGLPDGVHLIWGTGRNQFEPWKALEGERVRVRPYLAPIADAYAASDLAIARAGAMSTSELCAWGVPMLLVPLPTAAQDHQTRNAEALERAGAAVHLPQRELSADRLETAVRSLAYDGERLATLSTAARARGRPHAADEIASRILRLLAASAPGLQSPA